ncbi:MAG TPA: hypothetical protein VK784_07710, partial [Pseudonocardiaceae bacterium]|nr:hypothetical protein [Pseudonocardiaceae bacterium]
PGGVVGVVAEHRGDVCGTPPGRRGDAQAWVLAGTGGEWSGADQRAPLRHRSRRRSRADG